MNKNNEASAGHNPISSYPYILNKRYMEHEFHEADAPDYWEAVITRSEKEGRLEKPDADLIRRFVAYRQGSRGITNLRATKLTNILVSWKLFLPVPWHVATIDDLFAARVRLTSAKSKWGKPYSTNTISDHIQILKAFYRWLITRELNPHISLQDLSELKSPPTDTDTTDPGDLLTSDELAAMIRACKTHRDRALIAVTYETGARIGEVARLRWRDVQFDKYGVKITIHDTKEGKKRYPRLINSTTYLAAWRNGYYGPAAEGDAYVFVSADTALPLKYRAIAQVITRAAKRAGIERNVHPHLLRKSRITELVRKNYQESVIKETFWANPDTQMFRTYLKLSEKDIDDEFLRKAGLKIDGEVVDDDKPRQCMFCSAISPPGSQYCRMCTRPLTSAARDEQEQRVSSLLDRMDQDPRLAVIEQRIEELRKELIADLD